MDHTTFSVKIIITNAVSLVTNVFGTSFKGKLDPFFKRTRNPLKKLRSMNPNSNDSSKKEGESIQTNDLEYK